MVFATSSLSSTERYVGHLLVVFATSSRSNLQPRGAAQYDLDHCHVWDYDFGLCGTSMSGICYFIAEQY